MGVKMSPGIWSLLLAAAVAAAASNGVEGDTSLLAKIAYDYDNYIDSFDRVEGVDCSTNRNTLTCTPGRCTQRGGTCKGHTQNINLPVGCDRECEHRHKKRMFICRCIGAKPLKDNKDKKPGSENGGKGGGGKKSPH